MKKFTKALIACAATFGAILGTNNLAFAQERLYNIRARHTGQCLNVLNAGRRNGDNIVQAQNCRAGGSQWQLIPADRGYYYIRARHSGQCLNVLNAGRRNGDNVVQGEECRSDNFQWAIVPAGRRFNYLEARHSRQCLNVLNAGRRNGDNVVQGDECRSENFQWEIVPSRYSDARPRNWRHGNRDRRHHRRGY